MKADDRESKHRNWNASQRNSRSNSSKAQQRPLVKLNDWQRSYGYYRNLAENCANADPHTSEQHWQHAEHFRRLINESAVSPV
jgi:hypothetical protein